MPPTINDDTVRQVNSVWANTPLLGDSDWIDMPSGQVCKIRRIGMEGVLASGVMGDVDSLGAFVGERHLSGAGHKGKGGAQGVNVMSLMRDPEALKKIVFLVDRVCPLVITEPTVMSHFEFVGNTMETRMIPADKRNPEVVYTDQIGLEDKMFIFAYTMGASRDLERFRRESEEAVGTASDSDDVQDASQQSSGSGSGSKRRRPPRRR